MLSAALTPVAAPAPLRVTATAAASVQTDRTDYQPGQTVVITGKGFVSPERVQLKIVHTDGTFSTLASHQSRLVPTDKSGGFTVSYLVGTDDRGKSLRVTALGLTSRRTAVATFTDAGSAVLRPDHIVVVIEEDRAAGAIGDRTHMPYFNQLADTGLVFTNSHGVGHPSEPNYYALYSGSTQGVTDNSTSHTFSGPNLAKSLNSTVSGSSGGGYLSFSGYAESLPKDGDTTTKMAGDPNDPTAPPDLYLRNYNPMAQFTDVGQHGTTAVTNAQVNKTFASFPTTADGYAALPTVSFVVPNNLHNTHGSNEQDPYATDPSQYDFLRTSGDTWLKGHLDGYLQWAKSHNSLLIVTGDEEETDSHPTSSITTIINGDPRLVVLGSSSTSVNHYNVLRTIEDMYGLAPLGSTATAAGLGTNAAGQLAPPGRWWAPPPRSRATRTRRSPASPSRSPRRSPPRPGPVRQRARSRSRTAA